MSSASPQDSSLTALLHEWRNGSGTAFGEVIDQVYDQLRAIAAGRISRSGGALTLSPTELLHEVLIKVMPAPMEWKDRSHFFATMSLAIRSILVDHARARATEKRGGDRLKVTLTSANVGEDSMALDLIALDQALTRLEALDARCAEVMHLTYFGGLSHEEIAGLLKISEATVARDLRFARGWIKQALTGDA
jgi:RNA polymerase sigma factor (TIGR02999 family)